MAEAKDKLKDLANRTGNYAGLPDKVYYFTDPTDGETLITYGLEREEVEDGASEWKTAMKAKYGENIEINSTSWFFDSSKGSNKLTEDYINGLYVVTPSTHSLWPIWRVFIDGSNNLINNDGNLGQL
jgi:hypothetical protein